VLSDLAEERWPSMDLVSEMLVEQAARLPGLEVERVRPALPSALAALAEIGELRGAGRWFRHLGLATGRYAFYPLEVLPLRRRFDCFHIADHSYAHLALELPARTTGIFCHDVDAFRPLFESGGHGFRRALASLLLRGLRRASVVFHTTEAVRAEIVGRGLVSPERLVAAPYGIAPEFHPERRAEDEATLSRPRYLLHVGSLIPRKNPDFLLELFAAVRRRVGAIELVQIGGEWEPAQRAFLEREGLTPFVHQIPRAPRNEVAAYYRSAAAVVMPSISEGFGLPVIEALASGAVVVASDIEVFRQVGGSALVRCALGDLEAWCKAVEEVLLGRAPSRSERLAAVSKYTWEEHAATIVRAYAALAQKPR
jgi:glycosyltransferase involved in cell wall biosynthesis